MSVLLNLGEGLLKQMMETFETLYRGGETVGSLRMRMMLQNQKLRQKKQLRNVLEMF